MLNFNPQAQHIPHPRTVNAPILRTDAIISKSGNGVRCEGVTLQSGNVTATQDVSCHAIDASGTVTCSKVDIDGASNEIVSEGTLTLKRDTETMARFVGDGTAELYHNNVKKFGTLSSGTETIGTCNINGGTGFAVIEMGGDNGAFIDMKAPAGDDHDVRLRTYGDGQFQISGYGGPGTSAETMADFHYNGAVELYHDGTKRVETTSGGATITGSLTITALPTSDPGVAGALYRDANGFVKVSI